MQGHCIDFFKHSLNMLTYVVNVFSQIFIENYFLKVYYPGESTYIPTYPGDAIGS